ncbi:MAG TPA: lipoate--protein ligase family protein [Aggregatilineales bacterium]|nr:lipoate--protein ligase family protein [Aggregatilineales bacterium]
MTAETWRVIVDPPRRGPLNMAIDEAIMEAVTAGDAPPTLRLYAWEPACLSLGYAQHADEADFDRLRARGWDIVRRATGGRAILHTDELTYSVALPEVHPLMEGSIVESYRRLSAALMRAVEHLGGQVHSDRMQESKSTRGPVCFEVPSHYEITANGKKLVGSAQVRRGGGALQHGTLPLTGDVSRICDSLVFPNESARDEARERVRQRATTLEEALARPVAWTEAAEAVHDAFMSTFGLALEPSELSPVECERAQFWHATRYAADDWTQRL